MRVVRWNNAPVLSSHLRLGLPSIFSLHSFLLKRTFFHACFKYRFSDPLFHKSRTSQWTVGYPHDTELTTALFPVILFFSPAWVQIFFSALCYEHLPANSMEKCPSWEADSSWASQQFPAFYRIRNSVTVFARVRHMSLSWARLIRSTEHVSLWSSLIVPFQYAQFFRLLLTFRFPHRNLVWFLFFPFVPYAPPISPSVTWWPEYIS